MNQIKNPSLITIISIMIFNISCVKSDEVKVLQSDGSTEIFHKINDTIYGNLLKYYATGELYQIVPYIKNSPNGVVKILYKNGNLKKTMVVKNGITFGIFLAYDSLGNLSKKGKYIDGKTNGILYKYYPDKTLRAISLYYEDKFIHGADQEIPLNNFRTALNYVDYDASDSVDFGSNFTAKIGLKNCTFFDIKFYEGNIVGKAPSYSLTDTLRTIEKTNDSTIIYSIKANKKGFNFFSGILFCRDRSNDTIIEYTFPIKECYYCK